MEEENVNELNETNTVDTEHADNETRNVDELKALEERLANELNAIKEEIAKTNKTEVTPISNADYDSFFNSYISK